MERKIGEVFECKGIKLRVEEERRGCKGCYFHCKKGWCISLKEIIGECLDSMRNDTGVIFIKIDDMEERVIKLTLEKAKEFYEKGGELKDLALSAYTEKELKEIYLPKTWDEFCEMKRVQPGEAYYCSTLGKFVEYEYINNRTKHSQQALPSLQDAKAHLALAQLHQLRDYYRQGWKPDWTDKSAKYYAYISCHGIGIIDLTGEEKRFLAFQTKELAEAFLKNFRDLIIEAGDLV